MATKLEVPYCGPITLGTVGEHVRGYKRAVSRAAPDLYPWYGSSSEGFTPLAGEIFTKAVGKLQARYKIPVTNTIGPLVHELLEGLSRKGHPTEHAFDTLALVFLQNYWDLHHISPDKRIRNNILMAMQFWYQHKYEIRYSQYRPFWMGKPPQVPSRWDCSGFATVAHYAGGAPNPNRRPWDGLGYTETLQAGGNRCTLNDMEIADLVYYGFSTRGSQAFPYGSPTHVAVYAGNDMVYSMGSYPMGYYPYNYRKINHMRHYDVTR